MRMSKDVFSSDTFNLSVPDILQLRLDQLKPDAIVVRQKKTKKETAIVWTPALREAVAMAKRLPRRVRGMYLFCTRKGVPYSSDGFRSIWQRRMKSALAKGVLKERFTEHDVRAKAVRELQLEHAAALLGHADARVTERHYVRGPTIVRPTR